MDGFMEALLAIYQIIDMIVTIMIMLVIIQFIIGLLFAFNVINSSNEFMTAFYTSINRLLDPVLRPIRRILPETGAIDFSPLVLIVVLNIVLIVLGSVIRSI
ncbi:MAG: YggT family protein [Qipengyuania sp.]